MPKYLSKDPAKCVILLPMKFKRLQVVFYVQQDVLMEQFMLVLLKWVLEYCITVCYTSMHYAACSSSARVCLHVTTQARQNMLYSPLTVHSVRIG